MSTLQPQQVVSRQEWLASRRELLALEKAATQQRDELARRRRELPWVKVEKNYVFDAEDGAKTLAELFDGRSQLIVYHFMYDPKWTQGCKSCSLIADHYDPLIIHLRHRDVSLVTVAKATIQQLLAFRERMGWSFPIVSSFSNDFNHDFQVGFHEAEIQSGLPLYNFGTQVMPLSEGPGLSVFARDEEGNVYHTYSAYARGLDHLLGVYQFLDLVPKGRDEDQIPIMSWVRHHDRYDGPAYKNPWEE